MILETCPSSDTIYVGLETSGVYHAERGEISSTNNCTFVVLSINDVIRDCDEGCELPLGNHSVKYTVNDGRLNTASCDLFYEVKGGKLLHGHLDKVFILTYKFILLFQFNS